MAEGSKRLLQVVSRPEILGGGVSCAWSICQALPDWEHVLWFCTPGSIPSHTREALAGHRLLAAAAFTAAALREAAPDAILLHNTTASSLSPALVPEEAPALYYWHGSYTALGDCAPLAAVCRREFAVSAYLARSLGLPDDAAWYQPVPAPAPPEPTGPAGEACRSAGIPGEAAPRRGGPLVVGRLCNPRAENWPPEICAFYRRLAAGHPGVRWEFVGCPEPLQAPLAAACGGAAFHLASPAARALLWRWDVLLYESRVTHSYGRVVCEAQQAGCVPVVDARGGFVEQIDDGRTGFLCASPGEFSAALAALEPPPARRAAAGAARLAGSARGSCARWRETFLGRLRELSEGAEPARRAAV